MATYGDENLLLITDYTEAVYAPAGPDVSITNIDGTAAPPVTTVNGGGGGQATGPVITISGGTTGMNFAATGNTISLSGTLDVDNGGTGFSAYSQGDLLYASGATAFTKLAKDTNTTRYLSNTGTSNNPAWAQVSLTTGVTGVLPIASGGTNAATEAAARSNLEVPRVHTAAVAPAVTDDAAAGYPIGTVWIDTVLDDGYLSVDDSAGAAIWKKITP